jgi:DNA-binding transcriptional LysR family regulator
MVRSLPALEAFYWVVRLGGFQAAATRLRVSQPTVSTRVKELERRVGRELLIRNGHGAKPTLHGSATFEYAGRILGLVQDLESRLRPGGPLRGLVRLGSSDGFAMVCLGELLKLLKETAPDVRIAITVGNSRALERSLRDGDLDMAIVSDGLEARDLRTQLLGVQEIALGRQCHAAVAAAAYRVGPSFSASLHQSAALPPLYRPDGLVRSERCQSALLLELRQCCGYREACGYRGRDQLASRLHRGSATGRRDSVAPLS